MAEKPHGNGIRKMNRLTVWFWLGAWSAASMGAEMQSAPTSMPVDAERLVILAQDCLKPVEIQTLKFANLDLTPEEISRRLHQACLYLEAAVELDPDNTEAWRQLYPLYMTELLADPGRAAQAVSTYFTRNPRDSQALESWISWRLPQIQDRLGREEFLKQTLPFAQNDPVTQSRVWTQLGILAMEKGAYQGSDGAAMLFNHAVSAWQNNDDALARIIQLPQETPPSDAPQNASEVQANVLRWQQISRWRSRLHNNPSDGQALLNLIDTLEQFNFSSLAARYYPFALNLLSLFPDSAPLEYELRLRQIVNDYVRGEYAKCVSRAQETLQNNPQDILLSGVLIRSFQKLNQPDSASLWMAKTSRLILDKQASASAPSPGLFLEAAWYFSFIDPQPAQALTLAQAGQSDSQKHPRAKAILAYAYLLNQRNAEAQQTLSDVAAEDPIAVLTKASLEWAQGNAQAASDILQSLPSGKWAVLDLQRDQLRQEIQKSLGTESAAAPPPGAPDSLEQRFADLLNRFYDDGDFSLPLQPEKSIQCFLRFTKDVFYYGDPLVASVHLINVGKTELVLGPAGYIDPRILIQAHVIPLSSGSSASNASDSTGRTIPVCCEYLRQRQLLAPGESNSIQVNLNIGTLRTLLQNHPQQAYQIAVQLILDPVADGQGGWSSRIPKIQPDPVQIVRQAFRPTAKNLQFQRDSLRQSAPEDNLRAAFLLAAWMRQSALENPGSKNAAWTAAVQGILQSLQSNLRNPDSRIRAWTSLVFQNQPLPIVSPVMNDLMKLLDDPHWFVRFIAIQTLDSYADLTEFLQYAKGQENHPVVLRLMQWKQNQPWEPMELPVAKQDTASPPAPSSPGVPELTPPQPVTKNPAMGEN